MSELDKATIDFITDPNELRFHAENPIEEDGRIHVTPELLFAVADKIDGLRAELARLKKEYYQMDTNQSDNLRPCPFCGNKNPRVVHHFVNGIANLSHCFVRCNCGRGKTTASRKEEHGAVDEWNTRPIEDELRAEIARRDEIITRLKEDAERLAKYCQHIPMPDTTCGMSSSGAWNCNCGATEAFYIHRTLMKELE